MRREKPARLNKQAGSPFCFLATNHVGLAVQARATYRVLYFMNAAAARALEFGVRRWPVPSSACVLGVDGAVRMLKIFRILFVVSSTSAASEAL